MKIGFSSILGIVFVVLKLCGVIAWSWLWVLSPFWIILALTIVLALVAIILEKF